MMIRTIIGEAGNQSPEGQAAVAHVIMNRVAGGQYGSSPTDVVLAPNQFEPWQTRSSQLKAISPKSTQYQNVGKIVDAVADGLDPDFTGGATHFLNPKIVTARTGSLPNWAQGPSLTIGDHQFYAPGNPNYDGRMAAIKAAIGAPAVPDGGLSAIRSAINSPAQDNEQ